jgi:molybdopterin synthase catalytic subunit
MNCTNRVVPVGEASVMIAVSAEHRKEALEAVSYAIDQVKSTAAIWKKEVYEDEAEQWKENKECLWLQANLS